MSVPTPSVVTLDEAREAVPDRRPRALGYQPALDGLRGVALLLVLTYHTDEASSGPVPGGFLAVDVFFVLSGFLITTFLLEDYARTGRVVTRAFWARRATRLLPALFAAIALIGLYAVAVRPATGLYEIQGQILATVFYYDNWWVIAGRGGHLSPLGQAWSLSIEEQWYLVWPFALTGLLALVRGRRAWMLASVMVLASASWALMAAPTWSQDGNLTFDQWSRIYNGTLTRAWELLLGSAMAVLLSGRLRIPSRALRLVFEAGGLIGLGYLAWAAVSMGQYEPWVYQYGLVLVLVATMLIIVAVIQPDSPVLRRLFSWRPFVWLGVISYAVYLYHLTIYLWLSEDRTGLEGTTLTLVRWAVVFALGAASLWFLERPARTRVRWTRRNAWIAAGACAAILVGSLVATAPFDHPPTALEARAATYVKLADTAPRGSPRVVVAGDSLAFQMSNGLPSPLDVAGVRGTTASMLGCGLVDAPIVVNGRARPTSACPFRWPMLYGTAVRHFEPSATVLMLGYGEVFDRLVDGRVLVVGTPEHEEHLRAQLERARRILTRNGATLLLATVPCAEPPPTLDAGAASVMRDPQRYEAVNRIRREFAAEHRDTVRLVDLAGLLCPDGDARAEVRGFMPRADGVNLSPEGARAVWRWLAEQVRARND